MKAFEEKPIHSISSHCVKSCKSCLKNHRHQTLVILMTMFRESGLLYVLGLKCTNLFFVTILLLKKQINFITFLCLNSFFFQLDMKEKHTYSCSVSYEK